MEGLLFPIIMLSVTLAGGGLFLLYLKNNKRRGETDDKSTAIRTAQQFINVKDISDRILYTRDGLMFLYVRVHAINSDLFSKAEKNALIRILTPELSDIRYPFKFIALSRPVDISPLIAEMNDLFRDAQEKQKELLRQEILEMGGYALSGEIVERQFYMILWERQDEISEMELQKRGTLLCEKFAAGGIICEVLDKKEIIRLLNLIHNPSYVHLEDTDCSPSIPTLKGDF